MSYVVSVSLTSKVIVGKVIKSIVLVSKLGNRKKLYIIGLRSQLFLCPFKLK